MKQYLFNDICKKEKDDKAFLFLVKRRNVLKHDLVLQTGYLHIIN